MFDALPDTDVRVQEVLLSIMLEEEGRCGLRGLLFRATQATQISKRSASKHGYGRCLKNAQSAELSAVLDELGGLLCWREIRCALHRELQIHGPSVRLGAECVSTKSEIEQRGSYRSGIKRFKSA